jgi:hypothetical protein
MAAGSAGGRRTGDSGHNRQREREGRSCVSQLLNGEAKAMTNFAGERNLAGDEKERKERKTLVGSTKG